MGVPTAMEAVFNLQCNLYHLKPIDSQKVAFFLYIDMPKNCKLLIITYYQYVAVKAINIVGFRKKYVLEDLFDPEYNHRCMPISIKFN